MDGSQNITLSLLSLSHPLLLPPLSLRLSELSTCLISVHLLTTSYAAMASSLQREKRKSFLTKNGGRYKGICDQDTSADRWTERQTGGKKGSRGVSRISQQLSSWVSLNVGTLGCVMGVKEPPGAALALIWLLDLASVWLWFGAGRWPVLAKCQKCIWSVTDRIV